MMKRLGKPIFLLILFISLCFYSHAEAREQYRVKDVPNVQLQDYTQFVSDPEGQLTSAELAELNRQILELRDSLTVQIAIVVLPAIDDWKYSDGRDFANKLFNDWGIGEKANDNGLLILLLTDGEQREITFETGYGVEGVLTDGICKLIQTEKMIPYLREEQWGKGLLEGLMEIKRVMEGDSEILKLEEARLEQERKETRRLLSFLGIWNLLGLGAFFYLDGKQRRDEKDRHLSYRQFLRKKENENTSIVLLVIMFMIGWVVYEILNLLMGRKHSVGDLQHQILCENCGQKGFVHYRGKKVVREARVMQKGLFGHKFHCNHCGYTNELLVPFNYVPPTRHFGGGSGGGFGGGSWGGGGGSWGGGMSGGGGASTSF